MVAFDPLRLGTASGEPALLFAAAVVTCLTIATLARRRSCPATQTYALYGLAAVAWLGGNAAGVLAEDPTGLQALNMGVFAALTLAGPAIYQFSLLVTGRIGKAQSRLLLVWLTAAGLVFLHLQGPVFIDGIQLHPWGYYPRFTLLTLLWIGFQLFLVALALRHFWRQCRDPATGDTQRRRCRLLLAAVSVAALGALETLAGFGLPIPPLGTVAIPLAFLIATYATWRYGLAEVRPEATARRVLDTMSEALLLVDDDMRVQLANPAAERMFNSWAWRGRPLAQVLRDQALVKALGEYLGTEGPHKAELRYRPASGCERTLILSVVPLPRAWPMSAMRLCVFNDISATKAAETQREQLSRRLDATLRALSEANGRLRNHSSRDELTGVYHRRYLETTLPQLCDAALRQAAPLSLLLVEPLTVPQGQNEQEHTHLLRALAVVLQECAARPGDLVARFGGDIFCLVLPGSDSREAREVARKVSIAAAAISTSQPAVRLGMAVSTWQQPLSAQSLLYAARESQIGEPRPTGGDHSGLTAA